MQGKLPEEWEEPQKWRFRCPVGHSTIRPTPSREGAWCYSCNESYGVEQLRDLTTETQDPPTV